MLAGDDKCDAWKAFCAELQQVVSRSESTNTLVTHFAGRHVEWIGKISSLAFDELSNNVDVDLPEQVIALADGRLVPIDGVCLSVSKEAASMWQRYRAGDQVRFRATFLGAESVFPCCEIKRLKSGPALILLCLHEARPVTGPSR